MADDSGFLFLVLFILFAVWLVKQCAKDEQERGVGGNHGYYPGRGAGFGASISHSNPYINHDHMKHQHASRESAIAEVNRMQQHGYEGSGRLNVYYNRQLEGWYVGRSKY